MTEETPYLPRKSNEARPAAPDGETALPSAKFEAKVFIPSVIRGDGGPSGGYLNNGNLSGTKGTSGARAVS